MSKFLQQSKTFLPIVFQKSTTDSIEILQKCATFSTIQEELTKQEMTNQETLKPELPKHDLLLKSELPKQDLPKQELLAQEMLKQISNTPKESQKIDLHKSPEIPSVDSYKIREAVKTAPGQNLESLKVVTVNSKSEKTLLKALLLDFLQVQRGLLVLLSEGRVWLWWRTLGVRVGPGTSGEFRMEQSEAKEREPVLLSVAHKKVDKKPKGTEKADKTEDNPSIKSNLWEAIQENSPQWQESISNKLGEAQKLVVEKLSK